MVQIGNVIVSLDVLKEKFCCDLDSCKGQCCVEGDSGAPIEESEKAKLDEVLPIVWDDLSEAAKEVIRRQGTTFIDCEGDLVTSIVNGKDCVFTCYDAKGCCCCAIEKAFRAGKTDFYKPISCHLYPIRVSKIGPYQAMNYSKWDICKVAILKGEKENIPVYRFLKEPIIRKYGAEWYAALEDAVQELIRQKML
jgi:hypothetical protein